MWSRLGVFTLGALSESVMRLDDDLVNGAELLVLLEELHLTLVTGELLSEDEVESACAIVDAFEFRVGELIVVNL